MIRRQWVLVLIALGAAAADAAVTRIDIQKRETYAGPGFGSVGAYERIVGRFHGGHAGGIQFPAHQRIEMLGDEIVREYLRSRLDSIGDWGVDDRTLRAVDQQCTDRRIGMVDGT